MQLYLVMQPDLAYTLMKYFIIMVTEEITPIFKSFSCNYKEISFVSRGDQATIRLHFLLFFPACLL